MLLVEPGSSCDKAFGAASIVGKAILSVKSVLAFDPNDKRGSMGYDGYGHLSGQEPLRYAIMFENIASASAPAQEIVIVDGLDTQKLDLATLSLGPMSFGQVMLFPPPGLREFGSDVDLRPENNLIVRIDVRFNQSSGTLTWSFISIDPDTGRPPTDPLSGFLPPNLSKIRLGNKLSVELEFDMIIAAKD